MQPWLVRMPTPQGRLVPWMEMPGLDALGHEPARILVLADDAGLAQRRRPAFAGNADGIGDDLAWLSLRRCGEVIQPALGDVDYNSPPGRAGQNELGGDHHPGAFRGGPDGDLWIGRHDFLIAHVEMTGHVQQGIAARGLDHLYFADDRGAVDGQEEGGRRRGARTR